jgi:hypothetical protein
MIGGAARRHRLDKEAQLRRGRGRAGRGAVGHGQRDSHGLPPRRDAAPAAVRKPPRFVNGQHIVHDLAVLGLAH